MARKDRMLAALRRRPADRLPFATYNLHPYAKGAHAKDPSYRDLLALVEEKAGMYCTRSLPTVRRPSPCRTETVEKTEERTTVTTTLHTPKGDLRSISVTPRGQPAMEVEHFLKTDEDIERYMSLPWEPAAYDTAPVADFLRELGDRGLLTVGFSDPMYAAASLFDFQEFCIRCQTDLASVRRMADFFYERIAEDTRRKAAACQGLDVIFLTGGPEIATPPMMPPRLFTELVLPYQKRLIRILHDAGYLTMIHCHGRVGRVLDDMIATEVDALQPIEPPPQDDITLPDLLKRSAGRMAYVGYIQDQEFHSAPPGTMTRHVEEIARVVGDRAGYIMCPTCTPFQHPASDTWLRNYTEWIEAAARVLGT